MSQLYSINFNQSNQDPLSDSGNWINFGSPLQILNGVCQGTGGDAPGNGDGTEALTVSLPHDQYAQLTLGSLSTNSFFSMLIRAASNLGATNGRFAFKLTGGTGAWLLSEVISGSATTVASGTTSYQGGDVFTLIAQGTAISVYRNAVLLTAYTDLNPGTDVFQGLTVNAGTEGAVGTFLAYAAGTGNPFTPPTPLYYSQPDCRLVPNTGVTVHGTIQYTGQTSSNPAVPGTDSRGAGAPIPSGTYPQNNRAPGTFGPNE